MPALPHSYNGSSLRKVNDLFLLEVLAVGTTSTPFGVARQFPGRLYLWSGIGLVLLGPILYVLQLRAKLLSVPWYVPALATAGVLLILLAVLGRPTFWRAGAILLCGLLAGAEWYFLVSLSKLPSYTGPVSAGKPFPPSLPRWQMAASSIRPVSGAKRTPPWCFSEAGGDCSA
jgi:hypothetical protein